MKNPYETLGVARDANDADVKRAYHKLVMKYHPDKNPGDKVAEEKFKEINNAFDILKDPQKRVAFDRYGEAAFAGGNGASAGAGGNPFGGGFNGNPFENMGNGGFEFNFGGGGADMSDMMDEVLRQFGFNTGGGRGSRASAAPREMRGRDLLHEAEISLRDAYFGKTETVKFATNVKCEKCGGFGTADGKQAPICKTCGGSGVVRGGRGLFVSQSVCPDCGGLGRKIEHRCDQCDGSGVVHKQRTIEVKIPAGTQNGARLRIAGAGEAAPLAGTPGDLFVDVHIKPDAVFARNGDDLLMRANVPFATLALGGEIEVNTIDDKKLSLKIPAGTQIGERMRVRGHGMPAGRQSPVASRQSGEFGDLYVDIATVVPKKLSEKQRAALAEFAGDGVTPDGGGKKRKGWF